MTFILGAILSIVLSAANTYLGLFAGLTVSASIPAAVISMAVLRMFREVVFFESLFKGTKWTWVFSWAFHMGMFLVLVRHLRYFTDPVWTPVALIQPFGIYAGFAMLFGLAGLWARRFLVDRVRYISAPSDHLMLVLLLAIAASGLTWTQAFIGQMQGSIGEVSTLACLVGGVFLLYTRIASWRIMLGCFVGLIVPALLFSGIESSNPMISMPWHWHVVLGGFAFGAVFMATDPVTSPITPRGAWIFGFGIGVLVVLIRIWGGLPEGVMYAILLGNALSPLIATITQPRVFGAPRRRVKP